LEITTGVYRFSVISIRLGVILPELIVPQIYSALASGKDIEGGNLSIAFTSGLVMQALSVLSAVAFNAIDLHNERNLHRFKMQESMYASNIIDQSFLIALDNKVELPES
jgi:hypothetical protein